jgi:hypothetical protein
VDDGAKQLDGLRHALGQVAHGLSRPFAQPMFGQQLVGAADFETCWSTEIPTKTAAADVEAGRA